MKPILQSSSASDPLFIVLEYMIIGKLQSHLRSSRADTPYKNLHGSSSYLTPKDLILFTYQTARGMEFLSRNGVCDAASVMCSLFIWML